MTAFGLSAHSIADCGLGKYFFCSTAVGSARFQAMLLPNAGGEALIADPSRLVSSPLGFEACVLKVGI